MDALGIDQVDLWVKVTEHIPDIVEMIRVLEQKGFAYAVDGDVYYDVTRLPDYGKLSRRSLEEMIAGARVAVDERKRHPMDFALWKAAKPGEPSWPSPWGPGRPGWHIECSAMSLKYLGNGFDIHGGGDDLIFPHHENEIAQSEGYTGQPPFVRYWVHNGMIQINQEKMSKSLGNFVTVSEILERYSPQAVRLFMLSTHYRNPLNFSWDALEDAARAWNRLENAIAEATALAPAGGDGAGDGGAAGEEPPGGAAEELHRAIAEAERSFTAAMDDDFNTALALASLFDLGRAINAFLNSSLSRTEGPYRALVARAGHVLERLAGVLGLRRRERRAGQTADAGLIAGLVELLVELRQQARQEKDWPRADFIRDRLAALGITLEDTPHGTRWRR